MHLYINGEWLGAEGRKTQSVLNPATGESLGDLPHASTADLTLALASAQAAFPKWRETSALVRANILRKAAQLIRERSESIATIMSLEQGKTLSEARIEVAVSADIFEWSADEGRRAYGRLIPTREPGWRQSVIKEPIGVVAAFTPWNFPAMLPARKIAGSLGAGCTCIIKPSEETPASALELARALHDAGLPPGVLNVVFGVPGEVSEFLVKSPIVRKVTFTGSVPVGRHIAGLAAAGVKPATLELGGHAPVLVFDDMAIERVAKLAAINKFRNAGQVCISPTRFFVQRQAYASFVEHFAKAAASLKVGAGIDPDSQMGPLVNERRVAAMRAIVSDAQSLGAEVVTGGSAPDHAGFFYQPTVLTELNEQCRALHEEPFGPIALIMPFDDEDEAIARANALPFGLAAYAFTSNADRVMRLENRIESGMLGVNTFAIASAETPFGGVKDSGYGSEGGMEGVEAYMNTKFVAQAPAG
ncbi:NAD-dependent succinate-semialdehyde dehydrogenase [Noviherbaspirillum saxi]|uniref:NAD-dependent succinate-semialdehyde dehydrogenase n=2 Tax=Noviherbaspirillum saxi TaxID=2320863 RepID=A0A3A3FFX0_9BURK|nr:NAD-dependent succinate-semialdehyde dehydrogenase [Noviherbaspirillum saxi]RJF92266.1 NAD-dependent succinate-semialdehyde dehydrogenase [Noviherbaspirillum saxi]